jgi:hypothetical protein
MRKRTYELGNYLKAYELALERCNEKDYGAFVSYNRKGIFQCILTYCREKLDHSEQTNEGGINSAIK